MRIARFLSRCGVAARRKAEDIIRSGRVTINGVVVTELHTRVNVESDIVTVDGRTLTLPPEHLHLLLHKPAGMLVSRGDDRGRPTVYELLPVWAASRARELVYAGRLDWDSEGLLLFTTDGELANRCVHPRHHLEKTYLVATSRPLTAGECEQLRRGIKLEDGMTLPARVESRGLEGFSRTATRLTIREGRNRQVRRMISALGAEVTRLRRIAFGPLELGDLAPGECRALTAREVEQLYGAVELDPD